MVCNMLALIKYELYGFFRKKKNFIIILIGLCICSFVAWDFNKKDMSYIEDQKQLYASDINVINNNMTLIKLQLQSDDNPNLKTELQYWEKLQSECTYLKSYYNTNNDDISGFLQSRINHDKTMLEGIEKGYDVPMRYVRDEQIMKLNERIELDTYMMKNDIIPYNSPYEMNSLNFVAKIFEHGIPLYFVILLLILLQDSYIKEFECGAYKLKFTLPMSRWKMFCSKMILIILQTFLCIVLSILPVALILLCIKGTGSLSYPIWNNHGYIQMAGAYIAYTTLFFSLYFILISMTIFAISVISPSFSVLLMSFGGIMVIVYSMYSLSAFKSLFVQYIPFFYCYGIDILQGKADVSLISTYLIMLACIFTLVYIALYKFIHQDFQEVI